MVATVEYIFVIDNGWARRNMPNLLPTNIKSGILIGDGIGAYITGTFTSDANAVAGNIEQGKTAYVNGSKATGTMPVKGNNPTAGYEQAINLANSGSGRLYFQAPAGMYYSNTWVWRDEPDLNPANIKQGVDILGTIGTLIDGTGMLKTASGIGRILDNTQFTITGLAFQPKIVIINAYVDTFTSYLNIVKYDKSALGYSDNLLQIQGTHASWNVTDSKTMSLATPLTFTPTGFYFKLHAGYFTSADRVRWIAIG